MDTKTPLTQSELSVNQKVCGIVTPRRAEDTGLIPSGWNVRVTKEGIRKDKPEGEVDLGRVDYVCPLNDTDGSCINYDTMMRRAVELGAIGSLGYAFELMEVQKQGGEIFPAESHGKHYFLLPLTEFLDRDGVRHVACFVSDGQEWMFGFTSVSNDSNGFCRHSRFIVPCEKKPLVA